MTYNHKLEHAIALVTQLSIWRTVVLDALKLSHAYRPELADDPYDAINALCRVQRERALTVTCPHCRGTVTLPPAGTPLTDDEGKDAHPQRQAIIKGPK